MNDAHRVPSLIRGAILGAGLSLLLVSAALGVQHRRNAWPFASHTSNGHSASLPPPAGNHEAHARVPVNLPPAATGSASILMAPVKSELIATSLRAVATVVPDESRMVHLHTRASGWLEQVYVATTGASVRAGQSVAAIFSQELYASQVEYLSVRRLSASQPRSAVLEAARARLKVLGLSEAEIVQIERSGEPRRLVTLHAPSSGVVLRRAAAIGTAVDPSTEIVTIADLSTVWVIAEVAEADAIGLRVGAPAQLDFSAAGRAPFEARADFVYPTLSERTRSLRIRFAAANPDGALRPGLYGTAEFAALPRKTLTVPRDAVVDTGDRQHVFVETAPGRYEPRTVTLGQRLPDRIEIRSGLQAGDRVVAAGVFLVDSESRLRASGAGDGEEGAAPAHSGH